MKKIALAIAMATSASFASAQLTFDPNSTNGAQQACDFDGSGGVFSASCSTASQSFGQDAYNAYNAVGQVQANVDAAQSILDDANAAVPAVPADIQTATEALSLAQANLLTAQATFSNFEDNGVVSAGAVNVAQAEVAYTNAQNAAIAQNSVVANAQQAVNDAQQAIVDADGVKDQEFAEFTAASDLVLATDPADPDYQAYVDDKSLQAQEYLAAASAVVIVEEALVQPTTDLAAEGDQLILDQTAEADALSAKNVADAAYADLINDWENNLDSAVRQALVNKENAESNKISADNALVEAGFELDQLELGVGAAQSSEEDAEAERDLAQLAKSDADADLAIKEQEVDDAENDLANAQTPEETQEATVALQVATDARDQSQDEANNRAAEFTVAEAALSDAVDATADAESLVIAQNVIVGDREDDVVLATNAESAANTVADIASAELTAAEAYSGENANNPANALLTSLVNDDHHAEAIVAAVSDTFVATETNADAIAVNEEAISGNSGRIDTNETNIASNTGRIDTNETNIASNTARIVTNETNIASNTGRIETNETNIGNNATAIGNNVTAIAGNATDIGVNATAIAGNATDIGVNATAIAGNATDIGINASNINDNTVSIGRLSEDLDVVRSGVAATLAVAGMPLAPTEGWGAAIGTGYFDGESAIAAGVTFRSDRYNFKFAVGTSGGEATGSAGVSWGF